MSFLHRVISWLDVKAARWPKAFLVLTLLLFGTCFGPWMFIHFEHLWHREHYQFFPMMLLAVTGICWSRISDARRSGMTFRSLVLSIPIAVLGTLFFIAAARLFSPWLAYLSSLTMAWLFFRNIPFGRSSIAPLLILLPLPFAIDGEFVHGLQRISSRGASAMLDLMSVQHLMTGNVLEVSDRTFFVEEACSGIGSVFLLLATAAIYASWRELRLIVAIPLMLSAVFWAVAGNTFRIAAVAVAHERYALDLSKGTEHDLLGSTTYLASLLLLITTEQLILFLLDPVTLTIESQSRLRTQPSHQLATFWNRWTNQDRVSRIHQYLERSLSGSRLEASRFVAIVSLMLLAGSTSNLWSFRSDIQALLARLGKTSSPLQMIDQAPTDELHSARARVPKAIASLQLDNVPGLIIVSPETSALDLSAVPDATSSFIESKRQPVRSWAMKFAETPATMTVDGPFSDQRAIADFLAVDAATWTLTDESAFPLQEISGQTPVVLERLTRSGSRHFRHQFFATVNEQMDLQRMSTTGAQLSATDLPLSLNPTNDVQGNEQRWTISLTIESDRPIPLNMRKARADLFAEILRTIQKRMRTTP